MGTFVACFEVVCRYGGCERRSAARCASAWIRATVAGPSEARITATEQSFFGPTGCASATLADFRDVESLRDECLPALGRLACDATTLPAACEGQILR